MPQPIKMSIPHSLGQEEARRRIGDGFSTMRRQMTGGVLGIVKFQERWEGQRLLFEGGALGQTVRGHLEVLAGSVVIEVQLPEVLAAVAERVAGALKREGQKLLEKK